MITVGCLTLASVLIVAFLHREFRSALHGLTLSNGVEVLVTRETEEQVRREYLALGDLDEHRDRWDQAVLNVLQPDRPCEWRYLVQSLNGGAALGPNRGAPRAGPGARRSRPPRARRSDGG